MTIVIDSSFVWTLIKIELGLIALAVVAGLLMQWYENRE